jgi:hypothetical protein
MAAGRVPEDANASRVNRQFRRTMTQQTNRTLDILREFFPPWQGSQYSAIIPDRTPQLAQYHDQTDAARRTNTGERNAGADSAITKIPDRE